ncbi:site-specific recombinase XerD-like protein [Fischerella sp. NIES-4106]|nr:site-specific recombinase XerD-like protein [Fischerella sp. NIES-4106]
MERSEGGGNSLSAASRIGCIFCCLLTFLYSACLILIDSHGSWSIEIISKQTLVEYLNNLSHLKYTTHHKHQAILQSLLNFAV